MMKRILGKSLAVISSEAQRNRELKESEAKSLELHLFKKSKHFTSYSLGSPLRAK
ncbi:MAG: hypothetical protein ACO1N4_00940 [Pedobacter sp.]